MASTTVLRRSRNESTMANGRAVGAAATAPNHETIVIDDREPLVVEPIPDTAPDLIARVRASLRAAKQKTFGASPRSL